MKNDIKSGSHIPLHLTIFKTFNVTGIIECGSGMFSTKMFSDNVDFLTSFETNKEWLEKVRKHATLKENQTIIHHNITDSSVGRSTHFSNISDTVKQDSLEFYKSYKTQNHNMLFVDQIAGLRLDTLQNLHAMFDIITFHDSEHPHYGYDNVTISKNYQQFDDRSFAVTTGMLVKNDIVFDLDNFKKTLDTEVKKYSPKHRGNLSQITS